MKFVQIIEFKTDRIDDINAILDEWVEKNRDNRIVTRALQTNDRDTGNVYLHLVEFPSYEAAMENSNRPETGEFAARMAALCDGPPTFRNLDVVREIEVN